LNSDSSAAIFAVFFIDIPWYGESISVINEVREAKVHVGNFQRSGNKSIQVIQTSTTFLTTISTTAFVIILPAMSMFVTLSDGVHFSA